MATVFRDAIVRFEDETLARVRVLLAPESERFPDGVKYTYHYGTTDARDPPILRFDNHHGAHDVHVCEETYELPPTEYPGFDRLYRWWLGFLPEDKRGRIEREVG